MKNKPLSENELSKILETIKGYELAFIKLIRDRLGILIHQHQKSELHQTILNAYLKFGYLPQDYLIELKKCSAQSPLLEHIVAGITVGETYFFRDKKQIVLLQNELIPKLIQEKRKKNDLTLRIWSAGCASGEEIYTIAILLSELIRDLEAWSLNLLGTDINTPALQKAILGRYTEWSMRSIENRIKAKYFLKEDHYYQLIPQISQMVTFEYLNLNDDTYPSMLNGTNAQDLILCRNVLIYFDSEKITALMQKLSASLIPGGFLLLGASDPIDYKSANLLLEQGKTALFIRPEIQPLIPKSNVEVRFTNKYKSAPNKVEMIKPSVSPEKTIDNTFIDEKLISHYLEQAEWQNILKLVDVYKPVLMSSAFLLNAKATALANLGKLQEANLYFQKSLILNPTNKFSHFTHALVLIELNQLDSAEKVLRNALFLDSQFVIAHYQLGLLLFRKKEQAAGLKALRNALQIAKAQEPTNEVIGSKSLSYARLVEILEHEIELHSLQDVNYAHKDKRRERA